MKHSVSFKIEEIAHNNFTGQSFIAVRLVLLVTCFVVKMMRPSKTVCY